MLTSFACSKMLFPPICLIDNIKKVLRYIRKLLLVYSDSLVISFSRNSQKSSLLLVRLDNIGDFVIWLDSAREISRQYPNYRIILAGNSTWSELAKEFDYWDEVWSIDTHKLINNFMYRCSIMRKVHQEGFEISIEPTFSRSFLYGDSIIRVSSAKQRIGSYGDLSNISDHDRRISNRYWYTKLIPASVDPLMEFERNTEFLNGLCKFFTDVAVIPHYK